MVMPTDVTVAMTVTRSGDHWTSPSSMSGKASVVSGLVISMLSPAHWGGYETVCREVARNGFRRSYRAHTAERARDVVGEARFAVSVDDPEHGNVIDAVGCGAQLVAAMAM